MNTSTLDTPRVSLLRCYALAAKHEFLRMLRQPSFALPTLLFAPMFYVLFGLLLNRDGNTHLQAHLLANMGVTGVMAAGLFGFGVTVALDRERGWLTLKRAQPMPSAAYLLAKLAMAALFAAIIFAILAALTLAFGNVRLPVSGWLLLLLADVLGVLPFCAIGMTIGSLASASAAPGIVNLLFMPMSILAGLWMPLAIFPAIIVQLAPLWPTYHLSQLALSAVGEGQGSPLLHGGVLIAFTTVFFALARRRLSRE
jgi:ABC-2 type transport system permease protein